MCSPYVSDEIQTRGANFGSHLYLDNAPRISVNPIDSAEVTIAEFAAESPQSRISAPIQNEDAILLSLQLRDWPTHIVWENGREQSPWNARCGETIIYDLRRDPRIMINQPFRKLAFHIPRATFDAIEEEAKSPPTGDISYRPGVGVADPRISNIGSALIHEIVSPEEADRLFVGYMILALSAHVATAYGNFEPNSRLAKGGLAPWQAKRAKDMLGADLSAKLELKDLACECGLSVSHFSQAFRGSTGMPPHQWRIKRRLDVAKAMMRDSSATLAEIAITCGFTDQSHFTRTFTRETGTSPGQWRRCVGV